MVKIAKIAKNKNIIWTLTLKALKSSKSCVILSYGNLTADKYAQTMNQMCEYGKHAIF